MQTHEFYGAGATLSISDIVAFRIAESDACARVSSSPPNRQTPTTDPTTDPSSVRVTSQPRLVVASDPFTPGPNEHSTLYAAYHRVIQSYGELASPDRFILNTISHTNVSGSRHPIPALVTANFQKGASDVDALSIAKQWLVRTMRTTSNVIVDGDIVPPTMLSAHVINSTVSDEASNLIRLVMVIDVGMLHRNILLDASFTTHIDASKSLDLAVQVSKPNNQHEFMHWDTVSIQMAPMHDTTESDAIDALERTFESGETDLRSVLIRAVRNLTDKTRAYMHNL